jgi:hypothetical protein
MQTESVLLFLSLPVAFCVLVLPLLVLELVERRSRRST